MIKQKTRAQVEWDREQSRAERQKWLGPSKKRKDIPKHSELMCVQCGHIWAEPESLDCPKCRR